MGSYAPFEHYLATLEVETCPGFRPATMVFLPTGRAVRAMGVLRVVTVAQWARNR